MSRGRRVLLGLLLIALGVVWLWEINPTHHQIYSWSAMFLSVSIATGAAIIALGVVLIVSRGGDRT